LDSPQFTVETEVPRMPAVMILAAGTRNATGGHVMMPRRADRQETREAEIAYIQLFI
jgi:hypothetical protein